jgi:serine/threonine protein kinase
MVIGGRYQLEKEIGAGGSGTVYRAIDQTLGRAVAVKIFGVQDEEHIARFQREARVASQVRIPDVVAILDFGRDGDRAYIVMELLEGKTLARVMQTARMPRPDAFQVVRHLTTALAQMHSQGIVHRDVTPSNVFLTDDGRVVLSDFGLAAVENRDARTTLTRAGLVLGTPAYMAPEAWYGRALDARVDVYAVGTILYELLLGRRPHQEDLRSIAREGPVPPRSLDPKFPSELEKVILKALELDPSDRFPTANELLEAFDAATENRVSPRPRAQRGRGSINRDTGPRASHCSSEHTSTQELLPLSDPELDLHPDMFGELFVLEGAARGARHPLIGTTVLGRLRAHEPRTLKIEDIQVSRRHARIGIEDSRVLLEDLSSRNGTFLNDRRVERVFLTNGDQIRIGSTVFLYSGPAAARRVQEFEDRWDDLGDSVKRIVDGEAFVAASRRLAHGLLREAIGYRVDREIPLHRGFVGFVVDAPTLWIRQRRFALIFLELHDERGDVLQELDEFLEAGHIYEHLIVAVPVAKPAQVLRGLAVHHSSMALSVRRFDLVVLDRGALEGLVRANTADQFLKIVLEHGLVPAALSPYVLRGPVPEHMFFGRGRELKTVAEGLATSSFAVVAGRRMGKSSFLQRLLRVLQNDPRYHPVHINCEARDTTARFLDAFESESGSSSDADVFPRRVAKLRAREHGRTIVLLVDEVDALLDNDLGGGRQGTLFRVFRAAAHEGSCRFVFSGSRVLYRHLHDATSPFFNFAEQILLRPIEERAVEEIVEKPMKQLGIELVRAPELVMCVIEATSCHPNLVQILCHRLVQAAVARRVTRELVDVILGDREFQREFVETAWSESTPREKLLSLLFAEDTISVAELQRRAQERGIGSVGLHEALRMLELCSLMALRPGGVTFVLKSFPSIVRRFEDVPALIDALAGGGRA